MAKKEREIIENLVIAKIAAEGNAIAYHADGRVIFIPQAIPGDVVDIQVSKKRKGYWEGRIINLVEPSPDRVDPFCSHFGLCGGCKWQHLPYSLQLKYKQQQVEDQFKRIGGIEIDKYLPIVESLETQYYRNKLEYSFSTKRWIVQKDELDNLTEDERLGLGFHIGGYFDKVLDIKHCYLQAEPSNEIRLFIKRWATENRYEFYDLKENKGFLRNIIIRTTTKGDVMLQVVFGRDDKELIYKLLDAIIESFPIITSLYYIINEKQNNSVADLTPVLYSGEESIYEEMENLSFKIGPKSFYQTNSGQAYRLYSIVRKFADLKGDEIVYDLYTGTGTIALFLASGAKKVVGIEYVPEAIEDAWENARNNSITKCSFYAGDMKNVLTTDFIASNGKPDVIVLDPPRAGIHPDVANVLLEVESSKIIYVSCNPATQARDIALLSNKYEVKFVNPVDMFPHTHHVENVALLELKK